VDSAWYTRPELPDLRGVGLIALDTETKDDRLNAGLGAGWPVRQGHVCGPSVAWRNGSGVEARYFPIRHPDTQNFDPDQVYRWLRDHIVAGVRFVTQNGLYDWGWIRTESGILMPPGVFVVLEAEGFAMPYAMVNDRALEDFRTQVAVGVKRPQLARDAFAPSPAGAFDAALPPELSVRDAWSRRVVGRFGASGS
jgi:hypothetical protein